MEHIILTEDVVRHNGRKYSDFYDPVHLLQLAHNAAFQMCVEIKIRKREWEAMKEDGKQNDNGCFEVLTPWCSQHDCMNYVHAYIHYSPNKPTAPDYVFCIVEEMMALDLAGGYRVSSPLFHCATEEELMAYLNEKDAPFKRYLHLEHIMKRLRESEEGQSTIRRIEREQEEQERGRKQDWFERKPTNPKELYFYLTQYEFTQYPYQSADHGEGKSILCQSIGGWWKPRYLVDNVTCQAYEFMDESERLLTITDDDIDWDSLVGLPEEIIARAKAHSGHFPTLIRRFHNGEAEVSWQINPDGRYYEDEDGFGMTDDEEIALIGKIDRTGEVTERFRLKG